MKVKSFKKHLEDRLNKEDIAEIEEAAQIEFEVFKMLQDDISSSVIRYMADNNIGFNDLVRKMGKSPAQVSKIIKGEANLTLATIAQLYAIMGHRVHIVAS
ncbi:MAG: helix-turn-helix domain-containing protein [Gammaproteobacteria bacterium]|nr:helix-turn-helix domain-containing protein [Gammaproteobacteria bacterium]